MIDLRSSHALTKLFRLSLFSYPPRRELGLSLSACYSLFLFFGILHCSRYYNCLCPTVVCALWSPLSRIISHLYLQAHPIPSTQSCAQPALSSVRLGGVFIFLDPSPAFSLPVLHMGQEAQSLQGLQVSLTFSSLCLWTCADISHLMQNRIYLSLLPMWNPPVNRTYFKNCVRRDNFTGNPVNIQFVNIKFASADCSDLPHHHPRSPGGAIDQEAHPVPAADCEATWLMKITNRVTKEATWPCRFPNLYLDKIGERCWHFIEKHAVFIFDWW